jgi:hypothetical protein
MAKPETSDGRTRLEYILDVALDPDCERQWPQMGEVVRGSALIADAYASTATSLWPSGHAIMATAACTAMSLSPSWSMAKLDASPTIGVSPSRHPNGANT